MPIALGPEASDTEEGRAFFQDRLGLFTRWIFIFTGGFYVLASGLMQDLASQFTQPSLAHLGAAVTFGGVWGATRLRALSMAALRWLDAATLLVGCLFFAVLAGGIAQIHLRAPADPTQALFLGQICVSSTLMYRAVAVPSTPSRTFWLGLTALMPQLGYGTWILIVNAPVLTYWLGRGGVTQNAVANVLTLVILCSLAVVLSTVSSRVIFGLRAQANKVKRLGQYTLGEKIGEGGMGVVYRASHAMLRRPTAIKLLSPEKASEDSVRRFEREVQLTATLTHPNTVAIFDYGRTPAGVFYYAMEYLEGLNLEELVRHDGPQHAGRVIHILEQVGGALTEAHEVGLIHRDIKPANIILCERGGMPDVAKVVDFGLVKPVVTSSDDATVAVTANNVLTGTPLYMAPEVIRRDVDVDGRSDLYALGAVAYYLITGGPVFDLANVVEVFAAHLHREPVRPSARHSIQVPEDLEAVILRCLAKNPAERFSTARDLALALHACAKATPYSLVTANAWWNAFRARRRQDTHETHSDERPTTLEIDVDERYLS